MGIIVERKQGNWSKEDLDNCEDVIWLECNLAFLQSFLDYSSFGLQNEH